ncbi:MAG: hypothetical protein Q7U16_08185 [Agitococcus sp.]|nr:hypothetical protein [Agitococcus sp.]
MSLSSLSKSIICMAIALNLWACASIVPSRSSVLGGVLAEKGDTRPFETPLPVNTAHKKLAIGGRTTVGVKEDGSVWSWGGASNGEMGDGREFSSRYIPTKIEGMTDFIEVAGNGAHFLALRRDGTVWSWGDNKYGQLGYKTDKGFSATPKQIVGLENIVSVAAATGHSLALDKQGRVWGFGSNSGMELGSSPKDNLAHPNPSVIWTDVNSVKVIASAGQSAVLTSKGEVYYWGTDLFLHGSVIASLPKKYDFPLFIADVAMSNVIYVLSADGFVWAQSGDNHAGRLGQGNFQDYTTPVKVKNIGRVKSIAAKLASGIALDEKGRIWQWGDSVRFPTIHSLQHNMEPLPILVDTFSNALSVEAKSANAVLLANGDVYFWGINEGRRGAAKPPKVRGQIYSHEWLPTEKSLWTWK